MRKNWTLKQTATGMGTPHLLYNYKSYETDKALTVADAEPINVRDKEDVLALKTFIFVTPEAAEEAARKAWIQYVEKCRGQPLIHRHFHIS